MTESAPEIETGEGTESLLYKSCYYSNKMKTLNVKVPEGQYEEIEEIIRTRHYTSKAEFIRDLIRRFVHSYVEQLHAKAEDEGAFTPLEEFGREEGLE